MKRLVVIAALGGLAVAAAPAGAAELRSFQLPSKLVDTQALGGALGGGRTVPKVNVLLPDGYDRRAKRGYPVLWLLHGAGGGTDNWVPGIVELAEGFPGIIVMPDGGLFGMYTDWWNRGRRGDPAWASYHLALLRKVIERRFPIRPGRRWHAIGGISMGGQGALRYAALLPGYFGAVAGLSAFVPDMQSQVAEAGLTAFAAANGAPGATYESIFGPVAGAYAEGNSPQALSPNYRHTRIYLTSGDGINCPQDPITPNVSLDGVTESVINAQQGPFAAVARRAGAEVTQVTTCGVHTFGVFDRALVAAQAWRFFEPVPERPRGWTYRTVAATGEMWGLRFRFAAPPRAVVEFKREGRTLTAAGRGSVRISGPRGCRLSGKLPLQRRLPRACLRSPA